MHLSSSTYIVFILIFTLQGCITAPKSKHGYSAKEIEALEKEISFKIEPLKSQYFEGQKIFVRIIPQVVHNVDSVAAVIGASKVDRPRSLYGELRVFRDENEITHKLYKASDLPRIPRVSIDDTSYVCLQSNNYFFEKGSYTVFLDVGLISNILRINVLPTPDSLFALRYVCLADIGGGSNTLQPIQRKSRLQKRTPPTAYDVWKSYAARLVNLPQGYPYRNEGLFQAYAQMLSFKQDFKADDSLLVRQLIVEYVKEREPRNWEIAYFYCRVWLENVDSLGREQETARLLSETQDTTFLKQIREVERMNRP